MSANPDDARELRIADRPSLTPQLRNSLAEFHCLRESADDFGHLFFPQLLTSTERSHSEMVRVLPAPATQHAREQP